MELTSKYLSDLIIHAPGPVPLFVYGTLRPGGRLHASWIGPDVETSTPAQAYGYSLRMHASIPYPFMVKDDLDTTVGDLLWIRPRSVRLVETAVMEMNAGYDAAIIEVEDANGIEVPSLAFVWPDQSMKMHRVPNGDFFAVAS